MKTFFPCLFLLIPLGLLAQPSGVGALRINQTTVAKMGLDSAPLTSEGRLYGFLFNWDTPYIPHRVLGCQVLKATLWFDNANGRVLKRFDLRLGTGPAEGHVYRCLTKDFGRGSRFGNGWAWNLGSNRLEWDPVEGVVSFRERTFIPKGKPEAEAKACEVRFN